MSSTTKLIQFNFQEENLGIWENTLKTQVARNYVKALGSPNEIRQQNLRTVLEWLYRWGFSTAEIISDLLGRANRSHARRLEKEGFIRSASIKGSPTYFVLTERGLAEATHHSRFLLEYREIDPYKVHLPNLHHDLTTQKLTVSKLHSGWANKFLTQRMYDFNGEDSLKKIPDVIFIHEALNTENQNIKELYGVEVELTPKWNYKLDQFVTDILDDIQFQRINGYIVISDSRAILDRYKEAFRPGNKVKIWKNSEKGKISDTGETYIVPNWVPNYVAFREIGSSEPYTSKT